MTIHTPQSVYIAMQETGAHTPRKWRFAEILSQCTTAKFFHHCELALAVPCPRKSSVCPIKYKCPVPDDRMCHRDTHMVSITSNMQDGPTFAVDRLYTREDVWTIYGIELPHREVETIIEVIGKCPIIAPAAQISAQRKDDPSGPVKDRRRSYNMTAFSFNFLPISCLWSSCAGQCTCCGVGYTPDTHEMERRVVSAKKFFCSELVLSLLMCSMTVSEKCAAGRQIEVPDPCSAMPDDVLAVANGCGARYVSHIQWLGLIQCNPPGTRLSHGAQCGNIPPRRSNI